MLESSPRLKEHLHKIGAGTAPKYSQKIDACGEVAGRLVTPKVQHSSVADWMLLLAHKAAGIKTEPHNVGVKGSDSCVSFLPGHHAHRRTVLKHRSQVPRFTPRSVTCPSAPSVRSNLPLTNDNDLIPQHHFPDGAAAKIRQPEGCPGHCNQVGHLSENHIRRCTQRIT